MHSAKRWFNLVYFGPLTLVHRACKKRCEKTYQSVGNHGRTTKIRNEDSQYYFYRAMHYVHCVVLLQ